jgi:hypothetical protein
LKILLAVNAHPLFLSLILSAVSGTVGLLTVDGVAPEEVVEGRPHAVSVRTIARKASIEMNPNPVVFCSHVFLIQFPSFLETIAREIVLNVLATDPSGTSSGVEQQ